MKFVPTDKQLETLGVILRLKDHATVDNIIEELSYKPSKQSFQFSMRALINRELIVRRDYVRFKGDICGNKGRLRLKITDKGVDILTRYRKTPVVMDYEVRLEI